MLAGLGIPVLPLTGRADPTPLLAFATATRLRRRRDGHREPQPARLQRLQGLLGQRRADHPAASTRHRRRDRRSAASDRGAACRPTTSSRRSPTGSPSTRRALVADYLDDVVALARPSRADGAPRDRVHAAARRRRWRSVEPALERAGFPSVPRCRRSASRIPSSRPSRSRTPRRRARWTACSRWRASGRADLVLANDPDADRLRVAVPGRRPASGCSPATRSARCSPTTCCEADPEADRWSSRRSCRRSCSARIAAAHGADYRETLTGFKWICKPRARAEPERPLRVRLRGGARLRRRPARARQGRRLGRGDLRRARRRPAPPPARRSPTVSSGSPSPTVVT